ncbi:hypothetical protein AVEN_135641-1 [Araneus ventricosus]|uniref:Gustatory receptor n=1 Tax=Araneus ventricosus TaxID=182803 RepID=A0A4Y2KE19_ARAVE|nr:hypothetical protein AVEN_259643-1 [Araneus ventricosus]GBM99894.1 hypothetical protein AVEN_135641-1 [Araneus ventricosus]
MVALMLGVFYYEYSEFLHRFHSSLRIESNSFYRNEISSQVQMHTLLFKVVHDLEEATSLICFFFLCSQMTAMYYTLAAFMNPPGGWLSVPQICEIAVVLALDPLSVIGIIACSSRINKEYQKCLKAITLLKGRLVMQQSSDREHILQYLAVMQEKQFPTLSAYGVVELNSKFVLGIFGSLFTYSLLILNLKK